MILTRIQIENYKQYSGACEIEIPAQATVGVIGENGTGKTTLFEAIEWCLYSPRSISASDVRPRANPGPTTVSVHLESTDGTQRYVVERVLKRSPSATIYRVDESGDLEPIVQGPRQVTDYVAGKLIGLSHTAFTATFFTRQKELHLFGDQAPGRRREEVGRLLGLETIRTAQRRFTAERSKANAEAKAMAAHYEREAQGRDFATELAEATATIVASSNHLTASTEAIGHAEAALKEAEADLARAQLRREDDSGLFQRLGELDRERKTSQARMAQLQADLARLDGRARERAEFAPTAARLPALQEEIAAQDKERVRFERAIDIDRRQRNIESRRRDQSQTVRSMVDGSGQSRPFANWHWSTEDAQHPVEGIARLLDVVDGIDLPEIESGTQALQVAADSAKALSDARSILVKYKESRAQIEQEEQALLESGDPSEIVSRLDRDRERLLETRTRLHARRTSLEGERDSTRQILSNLEKQQFEETCPTCGRPFSESDGVVVIASLRERAHQFTLQIEQVIADAGEIDSEISMGDRQKVAALAQADKLSKVRSRILKSVSYLEKQQESVDFATTTLANALTSAHLTEPPDAEALASASAHLRHVQLLLGTRTTLVSAQKAFVAFRDEEASLVAERTSLGEISFDQSAFQSLLVAAQEADRARESISQIDRELASKPELEATWQTVTSHLAELDDALAKMTVQRTMLAYDPEELVTAQATVAEARVRERSAVEVYHRNQSNLRHAETQRDHIIKEQDRLDRLAAAVDARQSEADHLELMAKEFTEFERYAAARKVPVLGEFTSALVRSITDGRYERVEFDQDFGIVVHDGVDTESSYAVDTFSGGERDAITLAARIALSQMIGRQATNPPGFLVLDEVFGSLDTDRRAHLLDLLGSITATFDGLRQVFIISHVDDVRTSPVLDELWRVEASEDGVSKVLSLRPGSEIDTL